MDDGESAGCQWRWGVCEVRDVSIYHAWINIDSFVFIILCGESELQ
jgi:hypothetical protein